MTVAASQFGNWKTGSFSASPMAKGDYRAPAQQCNISIRQGSAGSQAYIGLQDNRILAEINPLGAQWDWDAPQFWQDQGGLRTDAITTPVVTVAITEAALVLSGQSVTVNAITLIAITGAAIVLAPQQATLTTRLNLAAAQITLTAQSVAVAVRIFLTVNTAAITLAAQSISADIIAAGRALWSKIRLTTGL